MRSSKLNLTQYDSDKISAGHLNPYDTFLEPWIDKPLVLLELGVLKGGSLLLWRDYFPLGSIVGIDFRPPKDFQPSERISLFKGNQADTHFLSEVANQTAPQGFDIIIDDASHVGRLTRIAFWHLFINHLKPGGLYFIEDWGTGYWSDWEDGKQLDLDSYLHPNQKLDLSWNILGKVARRLHLRAPNKPLACHSFGMVGFIKQLVDEQGARDATRGSRTGVPKRESRFEQMIIMPGLVVIKKA